MPANEGKSSSKLDSNWSQIEVNTKLFELLDIHVLLAFTITAPANLISPFSLFVVLALF